MTLFDEGSVFRSVNSPKPTGKRRWLTAGVIAGSLMACNLPVANAEIVFQENFDSQPDWQPQSTDEECNGIKTKCRNDVPPNWSYYVSNESWHPNSGNYDPSIRISSDQKFGGSGKSFIKSNESSQPAGTANYYTDGILFKKLDRSYNELYMSVNLKMQPGWKWGKDDAQMKVFRLMHFDGNGANPFKYFTDGASAPMYIFDLRHSNTYGWRHAHAPRCDPQKGNYYCTPNKKYNKNYRFVGSPTFEESLGDGQWHQLQVRVKMNSSPGANNGIFEMWVDGVLQHSVKNIQWRGNGSNADGWNAVALGGNHQNWFAPVGDKAEQWYAFDNVVVSTTPVDGPVETSPPTVPEDFDVKKKD